MAISSLQDVSKQRQSLKGKPFRDYEKLLEGIGNYFGRTSPTEIAMDGSYIPEVEALLNELHWQISNEGESPYLEEAILNALIMAAELSYTIKSQGKPDREFFKTTKRLGKALIFICESY